MPRRYDTDGKRQWNGKRPEEFSAGDVQAFLKETASKLSIAKQLADGKQAAEKENDSCPATKETKKLNAER